MEMTQIVQEGSFLTLHYQITLASGEGVGQVFAETFSAKPATLTLGSGQWAPGMEIPLLGHKEGDEWTYLVKGDDAYGPRNPELLQYVSLNLLREHGEIGDSYSPGDLLEFSGPQGMRYSGVLKELGDDGAWVDFNHPLTGVDLEISVKILGVL